MNRREVIKLGASFAALPGLNFAQGAKAAKSATWQPAALTADQNATVVMLTDLIIPATDTPGAKAANVNRYIDLFLTSGPAPDRDRFLNGLKWLDEYAAKVNGATFAKLTPEQQTAILTTLDTSKADDVSPGSQFFRFVKSVTARIYYNTEIGYQELNKGGVPASFACTHSGH